MGAAARRPSWGAGVAGGDRPQGEVSEKVNPL